MTLLSKPIAIASRLSDRIDAVLCKRREDRESGAATIEFAILAPVFLIMFCSSVEASIFMIRQIVLEKATDHATREVRLDGTSNLSRIDIMTNICRRMSQRADCVDNLVVEMTEISMTDYELPDVAQPCITRNDRTTPQETQLRAGMVTDRADRIILLRACYATRPLLPLTGLGANLVNTRDGETMSMVASTAFRVEPL